MKNVMVRAWEIAKGAVVKFGGSVKQYFAQALAMAWKEVKETIVPEHFGLVKAGENSGMFLFAVLDIEGLSVTDALNPNKGELKYGTGTHNATGKAVRFYSVIKERKKIKFALNGKEETLFVNVDKYSFI